MDHDHSNDEGIDQDGNHSSDERDEANTAAVNGTRDDKQNTQDARRKPIAEADEPSIEELQQRLEQAQCEAKEFQDKYLRAAAETENIRRRSEKERSELVRFGHEGLLKDFLPVLDSFEKAIADKPARNAATDEAALKAHLEGVAMVREQLLEALSKHGLEGFDSAGAPFDPNLHQAITRIESDEVEEETVGEVFQRGYRLNGRLLRPAMVSVKVPLP